MARRRGRGFRRQVQRKFVWDRTFGFLPTTSAGPFGVDLLAGFRGQPGATHLGATVTRIRGVIYPELSTPLEGAFLLGRIGFRIDSWNEDPAELTNQPQEQPDEDWMGWLPYFIDGSQTPNSPNVATWNSQANAWAVDIKSQRKLEELNQTLWMFVSAPPGADAINYNYDLSVGLKLP